MRVRLWVLTRLRCRYERNDVRICSETVVSRLTALQGVDIDVSSVRFGSVHLAWYEEALDGWTGPLTSRPTVLSHYMNRKSFGS
jgi:hypothetical protein